MSFKKIAKILWNFHRTLYIGDKWTLLIARDIMLGNQNFESIQNNLNIPENCTERLKSMAAENY